MIKRVKVVLYELTVLFDNPLDIGIYTEIKESSNSINLDFAIYKYLREKTAGILRKFCDLIWK
jgi:hypothetical protein